MNKSRSRWLFLSYRLKETGPVYGGGESLKIVHEKNIEKGDTCNSQRWCFLNHFGTHIDFPRHFQTSGKTVDDYPPAFWIFDSPVLVHRESVRTAHRAFLKREKPILLLEDMNLLDVGEYTEFKHIIVSPLRVRGSDAAPCTILAEIEK